jgi:magnesium chelatase family protein
MRIHTLAFEGVEATPVEVQVHIGNGLPAFTIVGLPDKSVAESRERVRAALQSLGINLPAKKILINLSPANVMKEGSHYDVPIALALLAALEYYPGDMCDSHMALGELALDGKLMPVSGILPAAMAAKSLDKGLVCPAENGAEAAFAGEIEVLAAPDLIALLNHVKGTQLLAEPETAQLNAQISGPNLSQVRGQMIAKRALEIAATGGHNLLMLGPPGSGKSMLASCLPGILPPMNARETLQVNLIASVAGEVIKQGFTATRPFRDPHHSSSMAAMVGGGRRAVPGEISLAHRGVLFLDELPEYPRGVLEALRQPMEAGTVSVARVQAHVQYPARFQLIAAMNPCKCGYLGDAARACSKAPKCANDYQAKISGPLLDRIDLYVDVPAVDATEMFTKSEAESSAGVALRVVRARDLQQARFAQQGLDILTNSEVSGDDLQQLLRVSDPAFGLLKQAASSMQLSMRGLTRSMRVARSIADLAQSETITQPHMAEALTFRSLTHSLGG